MTRLMRMGALMALACLVVLSATGTAFAWDRGQVETFAVLPDYAPGVPVSVTVRTSWPSGLKTQRLAGPGTEPSALKPPLGT